jgi:PKD repeat protein
MRPILTTLIILFAALAYGQGDWRVDSEDASLIARHYLLGRQPGLADALNESDSVFNVGSVYVVNFSKARSFVLVSRDSRAWPILAHGEGLFPSDPNLLPPAMIYLLNSYEEELAELVGTPDTLVAKAWQHLAQGAGNPESLSSVSPMLSSAWGQGCKYNASCPSDSSATGYYCYHVPVGCVATALGQIMRYWEYPLSGTGSHSYTHTNYGSQTANFGNTQYNWANMPYNPAGSQTAIPQLMYHLGVSVNMAYGPASSGSYASEARAALVNYFGYSASASYRQKISYSDVQWQNLLRAEIDSGRPVFYGGLDPNGYGGHAWVIDGYQGQYYHINWGWDGALNGYFLLNALNPQGNANFTNLHEAIIGIKPGSGVLKARFVADKVVVNPGDSINFLDVSTGGPLGWQWLFPGAQTSSSSVQHVNNVKYSSPGIYTVKLIVSKAGVHDTIEKQSFIRVLPLAGFSASSFQTEVGGQINFTDKSELAGPATSWLWTFQGGSPSSSTQQHPAGIRYNSAGTYSVSLKVITAQGQHTLTIPSFITVYNQCDTMLYCDVDATCYVQPVNASAFQISMFDLDQRVPYYVSIGHTSSWVRFNKVLAPGDTNFFYGATSWFVPPGKADNYLIFGPLDIPASGAEFQWSHLYWLNHKRDAYEVVVNNVGPQPSHFTSAPLASFIDNDPGTEGDTTWQFQSVRIPAALNGQAVYLAFHHTANDMSYLFLDDFRVTSCSGLPGSLEEVDIVANPLLIFPNPATEEVNVSLAGEQIEGDLRIYDMCGRLILYQKIEETSQLNLQTGVWCPGLYLLELSQNGRRYSGRLAVNNSN